MKTDGDLMDSLKCPVCLDFADNPMECIHCSNIFCRQCLGNNEKTTIEIKCPICRQSPNFRESMFAKRLLGNVQTTCPNECGKTMQRNDIKSHLEKCENKKYECCECNYTGIRTEFLDHIKTQHENDIIFKFSKKEVMLEKEKPKTYTNQPLDEVMVQPIQPLQQMPNAISRPSLPIPMIQMPGSMQNNNINSDSTLLFNENGNKVIKGDFDIYFCGKSLGFDCGCCDGYCGPDNGCCCRACMRFNIRIRNLDSYSFINCRGKISRLINKKFFCNSVTGTKLGILGKKQVTCSDGNTPCEPCQKLFNNFKNYL